MRMKKQSTGRKSGKVLNSKRSTNENRPGGHLAQVLSSGIGSSEVAIGGAPEFVASIHTELERWRRRFAEGEPMFVRGDITQPVQLWERLLAGKGTMAEVLRDGFRAWIGAEGDEVGAPVATGDEVEHILALQRQFT